MTARWMSATALAGLVTVAAGLLLPADPPAGSVGKQAADFALTDPRDQGRVSLADFKDKKAVVVLFLGTECPINNQFLPRLAELHQEYSAKGVQFLAINSNQQDTSEKVALHAKKHAVPFPVLKDPGAKTADRFGARRTPEAFVLDAQRKIVYHGRIDDQFGLGFQRPKPTRRDLAEALDEVLAGKAVSRPTTPVAGCLIGRLPAAKESGPVTYSKHIAPLVQKHCQGCHRPGQIGPMALLTYDDVSAWAGMIREVVEERRMPPWHADPRFGKFANDRSLPRADRDTLLAWIDAGCPKGDPNDLPPSRAFPVGWTIGKPDVVFTMREEFTVPAKAPRGGVRYQYFVVPSNFQEDMWVQAAEAKPGARSVVHHIIVYVRRSLAPENREDGIGDGFLVGQAPGDLPTILPPGTAKKVPKGAYLVFQMHYTPSGVETRDRSSVGLIFAKEPPKHEARTRAIANRPVIPPGEANHKVVSASTFKQDALLLTLLPHMHLRGKSFEYRLTLPDGKTETLLSVPRYDFNWQSNYRLEKPIRLPAGSRIDCTAYFDNSADNPNNPDPTVTVRWGDQTWEEMMIGFVDYVYLDQK